MNDFTYTQTTRKLLWFRIKHFLNQIIYGYHFLDQTVFGSNSFWISTFLRISDDFSLNQQLKHSVSTHKLTIIITFTSNCVLLFLIVFISFFFIMLN
jgi:hypothetical protein